jgi:cell fate regulator YaaT (PSP1 superfamily)
MPIVPLPQFEADLKADQEAYEKLKAPTSLVVRFGALKMVGEFPYSGEAKPGCGSKVVVRTHRGTELGEMLTSTCPNAGCSKSVTRKEMLEYIENSGGKDYPFFTEGRVLRIATVEDLNHQAALDARKHEHVRRAKEITARLGLPIKIADAEELLGGERLTVYFNSEDRIDFRALVMELAAVYHTRIEVRQVGARDEARLTADYEKCGQHCCCKQFLKVLKPVPMKNAKIQKATLDPLKISGRCGRLMCCLRYEETTYDDLRKRLPKKKSRVVTPDGPGMVLDSQILTQLVLVLLDHNNEQHAYPLENLQGVDARGGPGVASERDEDDEGTGGAPPARAAGGPPSGGGPGTGGGGGGGGGGGAGGGRGPDRGPGRGPGGPGGGGGGGGGGRGPSGGPGGGAPRGPGAGPGPVRGPGGGGRGPGGGSGGGGGGGGPRREGDRRDGDRRGGERRGGDGRGGDRGGSDRREGPRRNEGDRRDGPGPSAGPGSNAGPGPSGGPGGGPGGGSGPGPTAGGPPAGGG